MGGPFWLTNIFAAFMLAVAVYCTGRLIAARRWRRPTEIDTDGAHIVMGVAMAGMLVSGLRTLPALAWELVFGAGAVWFGAVWFRARRGAAPDARRCQHPLPHLVECAAMVFMFGVLPAPSRFSFLTLPLALFLLGYVVWLGDRLTARAPALALPLTGGTAAALGGGAPGSGAPGGGAPVGDAPGSGAPGGCGSGADTGAGSGTGRPYLAPRCAAICKITMGITMGYMLILML